MSANCIYLEVTVLYLEGKKIVPWFSPDYRCKDFFLISADAIIMKSVDVRLKNLVLAERVSWKTVMDSFLHTEEGWK